MLKLGNKSISNLFIGQKAAAKAFLGQKLVWQKDEDTSIRQAMNTSGAMGSNFTCTFTQFVQKTDFTISFWFKPNANAIHGAIFNFTGTDSVNRGTGVALGYGSNANNLQQDGNYNNVLFNSLSWRGGYHISSYSGWHHYAYVFRAGSIGAGTTQYSVTQYIDGSQVKTYSTNNMLNGIDKIYVLGLTDGADSRWVNGQVTRICLRLNGALTSSQIATEYAEGFKLPDFTGISHYWDGKLTSNGKVKDYVGDLHLDINGNASIVSL